MASRPLVPQYPVIVNGNLANTLTSIVSKIDNLSLISYSLSWSGTSPVANITVQVSNDYTTNADGSVNNAGTWNTLPLSTSPQVSGNTGMGFIDVQQISGNAIRLVSTPVSGSGTLQCVFNAKVC